METYLRDELTIRGLLGKSPNLMHNNKGLRIKFWSDLLHKWVEGSRAIAGPRRGEYAVRIDSNDPQNWCRDNFKITKSAMGRSVAEPRSFADGPTEAPIVHGLRSRGAFVVGFEVRLPVKGGTGEVVLDLDDYRAAALDLNRPPQCIWHPSKNGRGYVAARRPDGNATTLKSILAQAPGHEVWLKDGDQYNLRRDNFELHDRRVRRAKSDAK